MQRTTAHTLSSSDLTKEYIGQIKSYNPEKGYGFIDNAELKQKFGRDTFLNRRHVENHSLSVGESIRFTIRLDKGNPQAEVIGRVEDMAREAEDKLLQVGEGPHRGIIKSFNAGKGFGFVVCGETERVFGCDIFLHKSEMQNDDGAVGREIEFCVRLNDRGRPQAVNVTLLETGTDDLGLPEDPFDTATELQLDLEQETTAGLPMQKKRRMGI